jgi:hypothetical protein
MQPRGKALFGDNDPTLMEELGKTQITRKVSVFTGQKN